MIMLVIGILIGMVLGIFCTALIVSGKRADERMDEILRKKEDGSIT